MNKVKIIATPDRVKEKPSQNHYGLSRLVRNERGELKTIPLLVSGIMCGLIVGGIPFSCSSTKNITNKQADGSTITNGVGIGHQTTSIFWNANSLLDEKGAQVAVTSGNKLQMMKVDETLLQKSRGGKVGDGIFDQFSRQFRNDSVIVIGEYGNYVIPLGGFDKHGLMVAYVDTNNQSAAAAHYEPVSFDGKTPYQNSDSTYVYAASEKGIVILMKDGSLFSFPWGCKRGKLSPPVANIGGDMKITINNADGKYSLAQDGKEMASGRLKTVKLYPVKLHVVSVSTNADDRSDGKNYTGIGEGTTMIVEGNVNTELPEDIMALFNTEKTFGYGDKRYSGEYTNKNAGANSTSTQSTVVATDKGAGDLTAQNWGGVGFANQVTDENIYQWHSVGAVSQALGQVGLVLDMGTKIGALIYDLKGKGTTCFYNLADKPYGVMSVAFEGNEFVIRDSQGAELTAVTICPENEIYTADQVAAKRGKGVPASQQAADKQLNDGNAVLKK